MEEQKKSYKKWYGYLGIFILYLILHVFMHTDYWDDVKMVSVLSKYDYHLFDFAVDQYNTWTSRVLLMCMQAVIGSMPNIIWKILDSAMIVLLFYSISNIIDILTGDTENLNGYKISILTFLCFPYSLFATAGWLVTTIGYTWTFAMAAYSIYCFLSASRGQFIGWWKKVLFALTLLYAGNYEVICVILMLSMGIIWVYSNKSRTINGMAVVAGIISAVNILMFLLAPGNQVRMEQDANYHNTYELLELSIMGHLRMGINSTFYHFISVPNVVLFLFCGILLLTAIQKNRKSILKIAVAAIPLMIDIAWTGYIFVCYTLKNRTLTYIYPDASFQVVSVAEQTVAIISVLIMVAAMVYTLYNTADNIRQAITLIFILLVPGLLPEVILGFTTTVSASVIRVSAFFYFAMIVCFNILYRKGKLWENRRIHIFVYSISFIGVVLNFMQIIRHIMVYG